MMYWITFNTRLLLGNDNKSDNVVGGISRITFTDDCDLVLISWLKHPQYYIYYCYI